MGNFDDAFSRARSMAETLGKKSAEALELSRLKLDEAEAKSRLNRAYAELGRVYYAVLSGKRENAGRKSAALAEIERQTNLMASLEKEIRAVQTLKKCAACGAMNQKKADFCAKCGSKLDK